MKKLTAITTAALLAVAPVSGAMAQNTATPLLTTQSTQATLLTGLFAGTTTGTLVVGVLSVIVVGGIITEIVSTDGT